MTRTNVSARAAEWIAQFLNNHEDFSNRHSPHEASRVADLNVLSLKELKFISKEIKNRTFSAASKGTGDVIYSMPASGSKKAEWVSSIAHAFTSSQIMNIMTAPRIAGLTVAGSYASISPPRPENHQLPGVKASVRKRTRENDLTPANSSTREPKTRQTDVISPKKNTAQPESTSTSLVNSIAAEAHVEKTNKCLRGEKYHSKQKVNNSSMQANEAMARPSQEQYMYNTLSSFGSHHYHMPYSFHPPAAAAAMFASAIYMNGNREHDSFFRPAEADAASAFATPSFRNRPSFRPYRLGVGRPHPTGISSSHTSTSKIKVETESNSPSTLTTFDDSLHPRDDRESAIVESLRSMGFTDMREMLSGIRATSTDAEQGCVFIPHQWHSRQQAEAAMMWIVDQREEAAEAKKLDEARVSSEMAECAMKESRREEHERRLKYADLKDLFGSVELGSRDVTSKYFPCSVLLNNVEVRKILHAIGSGSGKDEGIRLLQLEAKAKKWYGTVLPFAHFKYVVCPRFEKWSKKFISSSKGLDSSSTSALIKKVAKESKTLEQGMYDLSEQEMGSFGMAPKLFLLAQRDAEASGKSLRNEASNDSGDGEVEIVSAAGFSRCSPSLHRSAEGDRKKAVEIIDLS